MTPIDTTIGTRILIVDDDANLRLILGDRLVSQGHAVDTAESLTAALARLERDSYQLLFLDVFLPDQTELEGLERIREQHPSLPIVVMTAHGTIDLAVQAMRRGAHDFVTKPLDFGRLGVVVERALESRRLKTEIHYLRRAADAPFSAIIGEHGGLREVMALVRQVAPSDITVLLRGETGTGKEVIARAIHRLSPRRGRPFVEANCAAIPRELMESEMFGHRRGAFTGAVTDHAGFFETACAGTLLLDEIGDLDLDLQAKILRVLEDGTYRKVGSANTQRSRARLVASTHQPLEQLMTAGRFREDLFYRLNVFFIELPPLRARLDDLPELAAHFLAQATTGRAGGPPRLGPEALDLMRAHPWRGNLRELRNVMERLALTATGPLIDRDHVTPLLHQRPPAAADLPAVPLRELERRAILAALERHGGNRTHAAAELEIGRRTLQTKLKQYGESAALANQG